MVTYAILEDQKMKITTNIDGALLKKALKKTGAHSQREVLEIGLANLLADIDRGRFVKELDKFRLGFTLSQLRENRA